MSGNGWLRPKKSRQKLRKRGLDNPGDLTTISSRSSIKNGPGVSVDKDLPPLPPVAPLQAHRLKYKEAHSRIDTQRGENRDYTALIHALGLEDPFDDDESWPRRERDEEGERPPGEPVVASLPSHLWTQIAGYLNPKDAVCLALASRTLYARLGKAPFEALRRPENASHKLALLLTLDRYLPRHLLCFPCRKYHLRSQPGCEKLQPSDALVRNPVFVCPNARNMLRRAPRHRIAHGWSLPFSLVQLATRAARFGPHYGVDVDALARRWKGKSGDSEDGWSHSTRFLIHDGRLLMRVVSQCFAPPNLSPSGQRLLLFSRDDYFPYFSVCAHWRDGELTQVCKCALTHVPEELPRGPQSIEAKFKNSLLMGPRRPTAATAPTLCGFCQPMRRCPKCPTEYLIEIKLSEVRNHHHRGGVEFRHALVVTRWSDLGDGSAPSTSLEWAACNGDQAGAGYDSFSRLGKRAISGIFEAKISSDNTGIPGRRIMSMNPGNVKGGDDWY